MIGIFTSFNIFFGDAFTTHHPALNPAFPQPVMRELKLERLSFRGTDGVTAEALVVLLRSTPLLQTLHLPVFKNAVNSQSGVCRGFWREIGRLFRLEELSTAGFPVVDESLNELSRCKLLKKLSFAPDEG